ncbi:hypothetical protein AALP_AA3G096200 [Arabis alpina]|uniref:Uncharacterized protein n=1 Tax=Arabis alpina TaxID=50452 RepID=A0A087H848_ARAAL|nr:hypothetical protein AALP_AA3G096200 [Arabis alpina]
MNPSTDAAAALAPPPQPPQPHRLSTSCDRHPEERFTGFCPSCLCERLSVLDQNNTGAASSSTSKKPPTISAAAIKALFKPSGNNNTNTNGRVKPGFFPELRRTKSFSASKNEGFSGVFEPQRRSCDVRSSLWNLFTQDEQQNIPTNNEIEVSPRKSSVREPVLEVNNEEEEAETENEFEKEEYVEAEDFEILNDSCEIIEEREEVEIIQEKKDIIQEKKDIIQEEELKPMKDYIDLDSQTKKPSVRRSFWSAASVFSKKLQKWRQNQKLKKQRSHHGDHRPGSARLPVEKPIGRQLRDTQSEIADYGFGRRSCDTDPRFSLDAGRFSLDAGRFSVDIGRISLDDPRYSFDEPRASWDGSLIGRTAFPPAARPPPPPSMLSVVEDAAPVHRHVIRSDMQIPVEEPPPQPQVANSANVSDPVIIPGGSIQTRDYYTDSSSRRRKSLDRSSSIRKTAASVIADMDEPKLSNASAISIDAYSGSMRESNYAAETAENGVFREPPPIISERKGSSNDSNKKSRRWGKWSILGLIYRKSVNKYEEEEEEDRYRRLNGGMVERSLSESWPELRNGRGPSMVRSNSNVSWRSSGSVRKVNGLERNKSSRYSANNGENGMLKFYLAPVNGSRRLSVGAGGGGGGGGGGGWANSHGHSIARSVMRLY